MLEFNILVFFLLIILTTNKYDIEYSNFIESKKYECKGEYSIWG